MSRQELEKIYGPYAEKEKILEEFEYEKRMIEETTGLKLSNIEAAGLRRITQDVMRRLVEEGVEGVSGNTMVATCEEIRPRFFQEFFDVDVRALGNLPRDESGNFDKATREWFRIEQEKRHLI